jgi:hypothetical protein
VAALEFARQVKDDPRLKDLLVVGMCVGGQEMQAGKEAEEVGLLGPVFKVGSVCSCHSSKRQFTCVSSPFFITPNGLFAFSPCGLGWLHSLPYLVVLMLPHFVLCSFTFFVN